MDFGIAGRRAKLVGPADGALAACSRLLGAEGVRIVEDTGAADIVIAAAARRPGSTMLGVTDIDELYTAWDDVLGGVAGYRAASEHMSRQGWGRFVWLGSAQAKSVDAEQDELSAMASLGIQGLHKVITHELGRSGVTANTVLRGGDADDEDVAAAAVFLCSAGAGYLSGTTIVVDGGAGSGVF